MALKKLPIDKDLLFIKASNDGAKKRWGVLNILFDDFNISFVFATPRAEIIKLSTMVKV